MPFLFILMKHKHSLIVIVLTLLLFTLTSLVHKNSVCCMFASMRSYGFPGQFITLSKEVDLLDEAEKVYTFSTHELLNQGWHIKFESGVNSLISQSALFNLTVNLLFCFATSFIGVYLFTTVKNMKKSVILGIVCFATGAVFVYLLKSIF